MAMTYDEAVAISRKHQDRLMHLPGVTGMGVKQRDGGPYLEVSVDPQATVPAELAGASEIDGLPLVVERQRFELL